jgi:hypothetical protein
VAIHTTPAPKVLRREALKSIAYNGGDCPGYGEDYKGEHGSAPATPADSAEEVVD